MHSGARKMRRRSGNISSHEFSKSVRGVPTTPLRANPPKKKATSSSSSAPDVNLTEDMPSPLPNYSEEFEKEMEELMKKYTATPLGANSSLRFDRNENQFSRGNAIDSNTEGAAQTNPVSNRMSTATIKESPEFTEEQIRYLQAKDRFEQQNAGQRALPSESTPAASNASSILKTQELSGGSKNHPGATADSPMYADASTYLKSIVAPPPKRNSIPAPIFKDDTPQGEEEHIIMEGDDDDDDDDDAMEEEEEPQQKKENENKGHHHQMLDYEQQQQQQQPHDWGDIVDQMSADADKYIQQKKSKKLPTRGPKLPTRGPYPPGEGPGEPYYKGEGQNRTRPRVGAPSLREQVQASNQQEAANSQRDISKLRMKNMNKDRGAQLGQTGKSGANFGQAAGDIANAAFFSKKGVPLAGGTGDLGNEDFFGAKGGGGGGGGLNYGGNGEVIQGDPNRTDPITPATGAASQRASFPNSIKKTVQFKGMIDQQMKQEGPESVFGNAYSRTNAVGAGGVVNDWSNNGPFDYPDRKVDPTLGLVGAWRTKAGGANTLWTSYMNAKGTGLNMKRNKYYKYSQRRKEWIPIKGDGAVNDSMKKRNCRGNQIYGVPTGTRFTSLIGKLRKHKIKDIRLARSGGELMEMRKHSTIGMERKGLGTQK